MNDSMDAFQLPKLQSKKKFSLTRRFRRQAKPKIAELNREPNAEEQPCSSKINATPDDNLKCDDSSTNHKVNEPNDTLYGLEELEYEMENAEEKLPFERINVEPSVADTNRAANESKTGGFCPICSVKVEIENCALHHVECLRRKFASKRDMKTNLSSVISCSTCGKEIAVSDYETHIDVCNKANVDAARKASGGTVTSSYFKSPNTPSKVRSDKKFYCPSCGKDLSSYNTPSRNHHVNICLDKSESNTPATRIAETPISEAITSNPTTCPLCNKTTRTARGLKLHMKKCQGGDSSKPTKRKKIRTPRNEEEELVQYVKGISASELQQEKTLKKETKRRNKEVPIPVMLQMSQSSRQAVLQERLNMMVSDGGTTSDDCDVPCTPALPLAPSSKWAVSKERELIFSDDVNTCDVINDNDMEDKNADVIVNASDTANHQSTHNRGTSNEDNSDRGMTGVIPSKFSKTGMTKWGLSTAQNSLDVSYRVHGLLTQFDDIKPDTMRENNCDKINVKNEDGNPDGGKRESQSEEISSTLNQLINLHQTDEEPQQSMKIIELPQENCANEELQAKSPSNTSRCFSSSTLGDLRNFEDNLPLFDNDIDDLEPNVAPETDPVLNNPPQITQFQSDICMLMDNKSYSDLTIVFYDGPINQTLFLHKCMLYCRLPDLLQVFENCEEKGTCEITCCTKNEIMPLIHYIYTGLYQNQQVLEEIAIRFGVTLNIGPSNDDYNHGNNPSYHSDHDQNEVMCDHAHDDSAHDNATINETASFSNSNRSNGSGENRDLPFDVDVTSIQSISEEDQIPPKSPSFVMSDDDLFSSQTPKMLEKSIISYSPLESANDCDVTMGASVSSGMFDVVTESFVEKQDSYLEREKENKFANEEVDRNLLDVSRPNSSYLTETTESEFLHKRKSMEMTPVILDRRKIMRMTGSTPKSPTFARPGRRGSINIPTCDSPYNIKDVSSIISTPTKDENVENLPTCSVKCIDLDHSRSDNDIDAIDVKSSASDRKSHTSDSEHEICDLTFEQPDFNGHRSRMSFSQPTMNSRLNQSDDNEVFESFTQPAPTKYKFRKITGKVPMPAEFPDKIENNEMQVSVNDSVLIAAVLGHIEGPRSEAVDTEMKTTTPRAVSRLKSTSNLVPITPMPNFSDLDTPEIIKRGQRIGLKKTIGKKKLKLKLRELHAYTHQVESSSSDEESSPNVVEHTKNTTQFDFDLRDKQHEKILQDDKDSESDCDITESQSCNDLYKEEREKSIEIFDSLQNEEFEKLFSNAMEVLHGKGLLLKALHNAKEAMKGVPRGSNTELSIWMSKLTPSSSAYSKEFCILLGLSQEKQEIIVNALTSFLLREKTLKPYEHFMFNILNVIYKVMERHYCKLSQHDLGIIDITTSGNEGSDIEELHRTIFGTTITQHCDVTSASDEDLSCDLKEPITTKKIKVTDADEIDKLMFGLITTDKELYSDILQYRPVYLTRFKDIVEKSNFKFKPNDLLDFLDRQGITFSTADERKLKQQRPRKRRKKTVVNKT